MESHQRRNNTRKTYRYFSKEEVKEHCNQSDCWVSENGNVYNVTNFLNEHPGGNEIILPYAGKDITDVLTDKNLHMHTSTAYNLLRQYKIGKLLGKEDSNNCQTNEDIEDEFSMEGWKEESVDWNSGMVAQVHKLGKDYLKWVHSPVNRKLKLFDSDFIEFFSKTPWYIIPIVWVPAIIIFSVLSIMDLHDSFSGTFSNEKLHLLSSLTTFGIFFAIGLPVWTLIEYLLHRYLFHIDPTGDSATLITLHFFLHGQHHKVPFDGRRLVFPPVAASFFALFFFWILSALLPDGFAKAIFCGGMLGYVIYDLMHYYLHHGTPPRGSYLHSLKYYHVLHHFDDQTTGYGISSRFWDYPFQTVNKKLL